LKINPTDLMNFALSKAKGVNRPLGKFVKMRESPGGQMHMQFIQDTSILWVPKALCSRSFLELFEVSFMEFIESGCFYYFPPIVGGKIFKPLFSKFLAKGFDPNLLAAPIQNTPKHLLNKVAPVKLGLALVSTGLSVAFLYALSFTKNLITEHQFKRNEFSDVIGLSKGKVKRGDEESVVTHKAKRRLKQSALAGLGVIVGSFLLARYGHRLPKNSYLMRQIKYLADVCDYEFKAVRDKTTDKVKHYKFDLGRHHLGMVMPFDILAYDDATRDHLEFVEVFTRTMVTAPYMAYWQPMIEPLWYRWQGKPYRHLGIFKGPKFDRMKNIHDISEMCLDLAKEKLKAAGKSVSTQAIKEEAAKLFNERLVVKNRLFFGPFLFGIVGIGMFTALMNRIWTNYRYHLAERLKHQHLRPVAPNLYPKNAFVNLHG